MIEAAGPKFCPCSARHSNMLSNHMVRVMERDLNVPDGRALLGKSDVFGYPGKKLGATYNRRACTGTTRLLGDCYLRHYHRYDRPT